MNTTVFELEEDTSEEILMWYLIFLLYGMNPVLFSYTCFQEWIVLRQVVYYTLGYGIMGEAGNYKIHNNHSKTSSSAAGGMTMSNHMNFSSGPSSSSRFMPSIPENVNESITTTRNPENGHLGRSNSASAREFEAAFPQGSWNDTSFNTFKRSRDDDTRMFTDFNGLENQVGFFAFSFKLNTI